jgi:hypothetical protein
MQPSWPHTRVFVWAFLRGPNQARRSSGAPGRHGAFMTVMVEWFETLGWLASVVMAFAAGS